MNIEEVANVVISILSEIQEDSDRPVTANFGENTCPLNDLAGFDSLNCVEASIDLSERFGQDIQHEVFLQKIQGRYPTVGEIAQRIYQIIRAQGEENE